ncbi:MAG: M28 family peptidase [Flavobacteriaceae bacterium]|nr:M28 family peptidase [Flavobacteriaceae bacterium]
MKNIYTLISILIISLTVYFSFNDLSPSSKKSIESTGFSVENALNHLKVITKEPHYTSSYYHQEVQNYIINELDKMGLETEIQNQVVLSSRRVGTNAANIIGTIKGSRSGKSLVLLTHYDSSAHSSFGASDAGSGVVTILEGVRAFLSKNIIPLNDIHVVFTDAEEIGLLGAEAFVKNHKLIDNVGLVLNFEARGSGGPSYMLMETNGMNSKLISEFANANPRFPAANSLMYSIYKMLPNDTDLTVFREQANINGFNFAFIGDHFDYHTSLDTYERLDRNTLLHQADYFMAMVDHFSKSDLSNLDSDVDYVYSNFPFLKLIYFSNSWIYPLLILSAIFFLVLIFLGLVLNKLQLDGILNGIIPFIISLFVCIGLTVVLWNFIVFLNPEHADMLHGFTYNGYFYIFGFIFFNLFCLLLIYRPFFDKFSDLNLIIFPLLFWIIINLLISLFLKGAAYFIIPVYFVLFSILAAFIFDLKTNKLMIVWTCLSIPLIYMFAPQLKMFPVGLGLKNLFISSVLLILVFSLLLPIFSNYSHKKHMISLTCLTTLILFFMAFLNNGFDEENKKPNSIVYYTDLDKAESFWMSYDKNLDDFTKQFLGENPSTDVDKFVSRSKYSTSYRYINKTNYRDISSSTVDVLTDSVYGNKRKVSISIIPQRKINSLQIMTKDSLVFDSLAVQNIFLEKENFKINSGRILTYIPSYNDKRVVIDMIFDNKLNSEFNLIETSFDLMTNTNFNFKPRSKIMMPMPFVTNDAIILSKNISL